MILEAVSKQYTEVRKTDFYFTQMREWSWLLPESACYKEEKKTTNDKLVAEFLSLTHKKVCGNTVDCKLFIACTC